MSSSVPAAVVGLYNAWAAAALGDAVLHFGPPMHDAEALEHVCVAYQPGGGDVIDTSSEWAALGANKNEERYEIVCALVVWSGESTEDSIQTAFVRAYALFAALTAAVAADYTLGAAVRTAHVASHSTSIEQPDEGNAVTVTFRVACVHRISY